MQQLQARPNDAQLLDEIGNTYYDAKDYPNAIQYYKKSLAIKPDNVNVRTDLGTAVWYSGDPDGALREYQQSLHYQPTHAQTLFNIGLVKWQGKKDKQGAIDAWEHLLKVAPPDYPDRQKVVQLLQEVRGGGV